MTSRLLAILLALALYQTVSSQCNVRFIVKVPAGTEQIFIAGTFNAWEPNNRDYRLTPLWENQYLIVLNLDTGWHQFKFTKGVWSSVETTRTGNFVHNRFVYLTKDTAIYQQVEQWADTYIDMSTFSTADRFATLWSKADYYLDRNLDSSYQYASRLFDLSRKMGSPDATCDALSMQGSIFQRQGNRPKALNLFLQALAIKKRLRNQDGITDLFQSIANIYEEEGDFIKAKDTYLEATNVTDRTLPFFKHYPLTKIAQCYYNMGNMDSANAYVQEALHASGTHSPAFLLRGDIEMKSGRTQIALEDYRKALLMAPNHSTDLNPLSAAYQKIGETFEHLHQDDSALVYGRKALATAKLIGNPMTIISTGTLLLRLFKKQKIYDSAFFYQEMLANAKDSLYTQEKLRQVHNIFFNETLRRQELKAQQESYRSQQKLYILAGALLLLLLAALAYRSRLKSKFYRQLSEVEMRALRAQMNPHFIFNCLASINRYIVKSDTRTASAYLTKFSKLIRLILDHSSHEYISLDDELQALKLYLEMEALRFNHSFDFEIQQDPATATENLFVPTMIIQPYVENAIWHGLLHKEERGKLWIRFSRAGDNTLNVEVEDNGIGRKKAMELRSKDTLKTKSYGMQISKDRIEIINKQHRILSTIRIEDLYDENGDAVGTKAILHLPCKTGKLILQP
jgi:tetratricopeptide (TPR) repeat protein